MCIDTGCVFGGKLTALRWPERELVSVPAREPYAELRRRSACRPRARPPRPSPDPSASVSISIGYNAPQRVNTHRASTPMSKPNKDARPTPRLPRGLRDIEAAELRQQQDMLAKIRAVYELYGFEPLETPAFEYTDALGKFLPDQDRPNAGVFSFQDAPEARDKADAGEWMSLRYDLTAPLARYVAQNYQDMPKPFRRYAVGPVWRNEKPGPGRFRQFMQFDADTVGAESVAADAEMCMLAADTLEALGIKRGNYVIKVNNRKVLDGLREVVGLGGSENDAKWLIAMRALDKLDRLGGDEVSKLLGKGRKDESGDFTPGADLDPPRDQSHPRLYRLERAAVERRQHRRIILAVTLANFGTAVEGSVVGR